MNNGTTKNRGGGGRGGHSIFEEIYSLANLFRAWSEFKHGKIKRQDVAEFSVHLEDAIWRLHKLLEAGKYKHSAYEEFYVFDPKQRHIHKAPVSDRLLHHAVFRVLEPIFSKKFIFDSYSSRIGKGTLKACLRFKKFAWAMSRNNTKTVWVLKCDIKKFFDSIDHKILIGLLSKKIKDEKTMILLKEIIDSFTKNPGKGIPLGNLTSQLFCNVYLDLFDHYVKRKLGVKHYIRYADDFVILDCDKNKIIALLPVISNFLKKELSLSLHPQKIIIRKFSQGIDFLGYVVFPYHMVLRTKTKKRILKKIEKLQKALVSGGVERKFFDQLIASYRGLLTHCRGRKIGVMIDSLINQTEIGNGMSSLS